MPSQMSTVDTETIVAGYDGSAEARLAAMWAAREAHTGQSRLVLVMAVGYPPMSEPAPMPPGYVVPQMPTPNEETVRTHAEAALADIATRCHQEWPDITISTFVSPGRAPEALARIAENARLLTIGASGLTGLPKVLLGSTAAELLHHHKRPLVVVRGDKDQTEDKRVVVGVDGSEVSTKAIGFAYDFADRHGFELVAVHAWSDLPMDALAPIRTWDYDWDDVQEKGNRLLAEALAGHQRQHPDVPASCVLALDRPGHALLEHAHGAALLVVGSHGRGAIKRALLGSVSHAMAYHAPCPVAVVHHKGSV
jgi:nucleotide-binding universal stress UspA family protein